MKERAEERKKGEMGMHCEVIEFLHESAEGLWHEEIMKRRTLEPPILTQRYLL